MAQERGVIGRLVGGMIRGSVRKRFHTVHWSPPRGPIPQPVILYANHHGWMDGYMMFQLITQLEIECVDWIQEFDAFPAFEYIGGMPYPPARVNDRAKTIRQTIRLMKAGTKNLVIFPEQELTRPGPLRPFGEAMALVARKVPGVHLVPVHIRYEMSIHERPEAFLTVGEAHHWESLEVAQEAMLALMSETNREFQVLARGTKDINERMRWPSK